MAFVKYKNLCISSVENMPFGEDALKEVLKAVYLLFDKKKVVKSQKREYHTLASVLGNGRFRDLGYEPDEVVALLGSGCLAIDVLFKNHYEDEVFAFKEPIFNTKDLRQALETFAKL